MVLVHPKLPEILYKYTSTSGLISTLENESLRFSRPTLFNDLYDCKLDFGFEFDREKIVISVLEDIFASIHGEEEPEWVGPFGYLLSRMRINCEKFSDKATLFEALRPGLEESLDEFPGLLDKYSKEFGEFFETVKVFCLSSDCRI